MWMFTVIILLCLNVPFLVNGQNIAFRTVSVEDGLSNNFVRKIYKDSRGFIWLGTLNGLDRFDGVSFKHFIPINEPKGNVYDIIEMGPDYLWIATSRGLWKLNYDNEKIEEIVLPEQTPVFCLYKDPNGNLLAGTSRGLFIMSKEGIRHVPLVYESHLYEANISGIIQESSQTCWIATNTGLFLCDYSEEEATMVRYVCDINNAFTSIQKIGPAIFLGTNQSGIIKFDIFTTQFSSYISVGNGHILFLSVDSEENLWVGTDGNGLFKISVSRNVIQETYTYNSTNSYSIGSNTVYSFLKDEDMLWVGTYSSGLSYSINKLFQSYQFKDFSTRNLHVRSLYINKYKKVIGTRDGMIYVDEEKGLVKKYQTGEINGYLPSNIITSIFPYGEKLLLGTLNGLSVFDTTRLAFQEFNKDPFFKSGSFYGFDTDKNDNLWMATFKGVVCVTKNGEIINYTRQNSSLSDNIVHSILSDSKGRLWAGTKSGVCYYDSVSDIFKRVEILPPSIDNCKITHIYEDRNSYIWFCTETDGLFRVDASLKEYEQYTTGDLLPDKAVTSIIEDEMGYFWIATHKGLVRTTFTGNKKYTYWLSDGLPGLMFNPGACYYDSVHKRMWWGNENGLVYCDIENMNMNPSSSPVHLTGLSVNGKEISVADESFLSKAIDRSTDIKLSRFRNSFGFDFVALNYIYPNDNIFETRLEGFNKDWEVLDKGKTSVYYGDIPPGKYTFRVRLSGYPESEKSITISIQRNWRTFIWTIPILGVLLLWIFLRKKTSVLVRKQRTISGQKEQKTISNTKDYSFRHKALLKLMQEKKPYLDPDLKMSYLTAELKCTPKELSLIFKESIQESFPDFINKYRVEEFKEKIKNKDYEKYTLVALSEQCGFSSRSSFFRIFKKITGLTPVEYLKQMAKSK